MKFLSYIYNYSGLLTVLSSWIFFLIPFIYYKKSFPLNLISEVSTVENGKKRIVNVGVYIASVLQMLFSGFLYNRTAYIGKIGSICLLIGSFIFFIAGYVNIYRNRKIHTTLVHTYAKLLLLSFLLVSIEMVFTYNIGWLLFLIIATSSIIANYLFQKNRKWQSETLIIVATNLWALLYYLFIF